MYFSKPVFNLLQDNDILFKEKLMDFVKYEEKGIIGVITISREKALNALNSQVWDELDKTLDAVDINNIRCLILTGAGEKSFVAGADISEMSKAIKIEWDAFGKKRNYLFS